MNKINLSQYLCCILKLLLQGVYILLNAVFFLEYLMYKKINMAMHTDYFLCRLLVSLFSIIFIIKYCNLYKIKFFIGIVLIESILNIILFIMYSKHYIGIGFLKTKEMQELIKNNTYFFFIIIQNLILLFITILSTFINFKKYYKSNKYQIKEIKKPLLIKY